MDMDAVEPKARKNADSKDDEADDLADAFGQLGVTRKCQVCMTEYVNNMRIIGICQHSIQAYTEERWWGRVGYTLH
jgi:hypothetical protein